MQDTVEINDRFTVAKFAPDAEQVRRAAREGFRSIINMQTGNEEKKLGMQPEEEGIVAGEAGLTYLHYPVDADQLSDALVDLFRRKALELPSPVLAHCASGKRASAMVMMHVACEEGMGGDTVIAKAEEMGFECDTPELEKFVKDYVSNRNDRG
ncbi:beta-lactamase hydrolase domain-containing protein [Leisingera methylohalidivorans]|uniref:Beta-lactamase hydrolase-like protein phosphatase-like domain-containing protein n=1 Tax=Leisingera methylohalidivorans DSM 14336 TaxID=999552 RepID=V9VMY3_9RHOB|nr:protein tyrosine phosphatase family protein [Leisingera methylohalidivorans]AHC99357.1 hypothetical protein METH_00400 [Leisingera methylohalidivorans DSM 14336]